MKTRSLSLAADHAEQLASDRALAEAYKAQGDVKMELGLFEAGGRELRALAGHGPS